MLPASIRHNRKTAIMSSRNPSFFQISSDGTGLQLRLAEGNVAANASGEISIEKLAKLVEKAFRSLSTANSLQSAANCSVPAKSNPSHLKPGGAGNKNNSKELRIAGLLFDACATIKELR